MSPLCLLFTASDVLLDTDLLCYQARTESQCSAEQAWLEGENVWLVHRDGFAAGRQLRETEDGEPLPEGRVSVKLDYNGEVVEVDEDDVEKANPPSFDRLEDLAQLR